MASIADTQRYTTLHGRQVGYNNGHGGYASQYGGRGHHMNSYGMPHSPNDIASLAHSMQGMNLQNNTFASQVKTAMSSGAAAHLNGLPSNPAMHSTIYGAAVPYGYAAAYTTGPGQASGMYTPQASQYMPQIGYQGYHNENSPMSHHWTPTTTAGADVPTLITPRRDSISSAENDLPATPSYVNYANLAHTGVTINRSPTGVFTTSTPSPTSLAGPYSVLMGKQPEQLEVSPRLKMLITQKPAIPRAIPAPSSPLKPLDRALENQRGETNVYIRGLLPETTDEMLEQWGTRFGDIKSSKSIIDLNTGLCKGFGFVKYHNYEDAENCIRGFHFLGYEVSFARESFYSKLKTFSDDHNTNLYVSNLPKSMNEHELANFFAPHRVCSARILRDKNGRGRGVGFARFENRDACEEVIRTFNNRMLEDNDDLSIQIRYADTQEQKALKQQTHAARQFRSAEYEYATQAWRQGRLSSTGSSEGDHKGVFNEFEQYPGGATLTGASVPSQTSRWSHGASKTLPGRSPLGGVPYTNPYTNANLSKTNDESPTNGEATLEAKEEVNVKTEDTSSNKSATSATLKQE